MEKSLLGTKENQNKKRMSWACGQRHVARGIPAGLGHMSGWWPSLCRAAPAHCRMRLTHSSERQRPGLLGEALQRNGKWFSVLMAESELMGFFFFCQAQLLWKMYLFLNFLLSCLTFTFYVFFWNNQNKPKQQTVWKHCIICQTGWICRGSGHWGSCRIEVNL